MDWHEDSDPALAPVVPEPGAEGQAMQAAARLATGRRSAFARWAALVFGALLSFVLSVAAWDFVTGLLARNTLLGTVAFVLVGLAVLVALTLALREWGAYLRLGRLDKLRMAAEAAHAARDLKAARRAVDGVAALYAGRAQARLALARLKERRADVLDADGLLALAEVELMAAPDQAARREIESAARQVATITALVPLALADVAAALFANLRMIRRIAEIYGGRAGSFGSWRLLRRVFGYLIATGALAVGDDLIGSVAGGGLLSKLSRRFGEGMMNAALTARVGIAAMELCRPLPFTALPKPRVTGILGRGLQGLLGYGPAVAGLAEPAAKPVPVRGKT
ncbi:TIGR01620 family protein [Paracoccaceae bacterium Fryx2]|nr:TIGR01620 family protein [Paracoccaceae bacterium Fryx2]